MVKWAEVIQKPGYLQLSPLEKHQAQEQYFNEVVSPHVPETDLGIAKDQFFTEFPSQIDVKAKAFLQPSHTPGQTVIEPLPTPTFDLQKQVGVSTLIKPQGVDVSMLPQPKKPEQTVTDVSIRPVYEGIKQAITAPAKETRLDFLKHSIPGYEIAKTGLDLVSGIGGFITDVGVRGILLTAFPNEDPKAISDFSKEFSEKVFTLGGLTRDMPESKISELTNTILAAPFTMTKGAKDLFLSELPISPVNKERLVTLTDAGMLLGAGKKITNKVFKSPVKPVKGVSGKTVGIDAETGLPIIDRSIKEEAIPNEQKVQGKGQEVVSPQEPLKAKEGAIEAPPETVPPPTLKPPTPMDIAKDLKKTELEDYAVADIPGALKKAEEKHINITDSNTGWINKHSEESTQRLFDWSKENDADMSRAHIDVKHMKGLNKEFGHNVTDKHLKNITSIIKQSVEESGIKDATFKRDHERGDEFVVEAPNTPEIVLDNAMKKAYDKIEAYVDSEGLRGLKDANGNVKDSGIHYNVANAKNFKTLDDFKNANDAKRVIKSVEEGGKNVSGSINKEIGAGTPERQSAGVIEGGKENLTGDRGQEPKTQGQEPVQELKTTPQPQADGRSKPQLTEGAQTLKSPLIERIKAKQRAKSIVPSNDEMVQQYIANQKLSTQTHNVDALEASINNNAELKGILADYTPEKGNRAVEIIDKAIKENALPESKTESGQFAPKGFDYKDESLVKKSTLAERLKARREQQAISPEAKISTEAKEPWQQTREEKISSDKPYWDYVKNAEAAMKARARLEPGTSRARVTSANARWAQYADARDLRVEKIVEDHKREIKQALSEGKPVPPEVLRDYPDLREVLTPVKTKPVKTKSVQKDMFGAAGDESQISPDLSRPAGDAGQLELAKKDVSGKIPSEEYTPEKGSLFTAKEDAQVRETVKKEGTAQRTLPQVEKELGTEVDKAIGDIAPPAGLSVKVVNGSIFPLSGKSAVTFPSAIEARYQASKGVRPEGLLSKIKDMLQSAWNKSTRVYEHLPNTAEYAPLKNDLLKLTKQKGVASDRTVRAIQGITINLRKSDYDLFTRKVILDDLHATAEKGKELPFGFTPDLLTESKSKVDAAVSGNKTVSEAVAKRTKLWDAIKNDYSAAMQSIGFDPSSRFTNENYFRHQILEYATTKGSGLFGAGRELKTPTGRGFLRRREGSKLDINSDYIQAEHEVMAQMLHDIEVAKTIKAIDSKYNIVDKVKADAKEKGLNDWHEAIPDGYGTWQPREGQVFYMTDTIPARLAEQLHEGALRELGITEEMLRKSLAVGGKRREFVLKNEIIETLDNLNQQRPDSAFLNVDRALLKGWKVWTLISPRRFFKYNIRNLTGDADAVAVGNPSAFKKLPQASKELYNVMFGDKSMTTDMKGWFERGGMESTLQAQEMGDLNQLKMFVHLHEAKGSIKEIPLAVWQKYWKTARLSTDFREAQLRYSSYLDYLEQMKGNAEGKPKNFGASRPEEVMAIKDIKDRAYWLSNDLLGAYDKVSVTGQKLREYLYPFWSWKEVNFKRYIQLAKNASEDGRLAEFVGKKALGTLAKSPFIAAQAGKFLIKATAFWSILQIWNNSRFPDEERELSQDERARPHIIFGRDKDGKIIYFNRIGALGDFLQWFGLDAAPKRVDDWFKGKKTLKEIAVDMVKSPANVLVSGTSPFVKTPFEIIARRSLFPDAFKPGTIRDRGLAIARNLGLENEYVSVMDLPSRGYQESLSKFFIYKADPLETAYRAIQDEKQRFLRKLGKESEGFWITPKGEALYNFKLALRYKDKEAAQRYLVEYFKMGGNSKGLTRSLAAMAPLFGLSNDDAEVFMKSLDSDGKDNLKKAIKFYQKNLGVNPEKP